MDTGQVQDLSLIKGNKNLIRIDNKFKIKFLKQNLLSN